MVIFTPFSTKMAIIASIMVNKKDRILNIYLLNCSEKLIE